MTTVRTRFAPSPTGSLHIGNLRSALFTWMFARHYGGQFILRVEDTDQKRYDSTAFATLVEALRWTGLDWDEGPDIGGPHGPYVQSERLEHYQKWGHWLVENGHAYRCYCTEDRLEQVNKEKIARKEAPGYDRHCRTLSAEERVQQDAAGLPYVIRFKMPLEGQTVVPDVIRGDVVFENNLMQDAVLLKSDGFPTYHLAVIVDDHLMEVSHVMRSNEWLPSAPLHVLLYHAFGWEMPVWVHLPLLLNPDGKGKMSKRKPPRDKHGNLIPVMVHDYMRAGYLPEALTNFLANTGWNFGDDREVFTMAEAVERFDLSRLNPANSAYTQEKLDWLNGEHIRALPVDELARRLRKPLEDAGLTVDESRLQQVAPLVQIRLKKLNDAVDMAGFFFHAHFVPPAPEDLVQKKMDTASTRDMLAAAYPVLESLDDFSPASQLEAMDALTGVLGVSRSQLFGGLRVAVTGQAVSTPTFETMEILGKTESLRRIQMAIQLLDSNAA